MTCGNPCPVGDSRVTSPVCHSPRHATRRYGLAYRLLWAAQRHKSIHDDGGTFAPGMATPGRSELPPSEPKRLTASEAPASSVLMRFGAKNE